MLGKTVSHYRILERIGSGGMGVVYRAEDLRLGRQVALKFLPNEVSQDADAIQRFRREARAASALNHPNICTIYDVDEASGQQFIAMELLEGETLRERIARGAIDLAQAIQLAIEIADALEAAHAKQIIHRDIKPANIFLTHRGTVKVLDFGLAKLGAKTSELAATAADLTQVGTSMGTVAYMSPEQARGEEVDARTDLFSLGRVVYEMATGRSMLPLGINTVMMFDAILNKPSTVPSSINPAIPFQVDDIVRKAVAKNRTDRYSSAAKMREDLLAAVAASRASTTEVTPSIAVLPFSDMSPQKDQDYFCEGMAEELLNALTKVEGLRVTSRTSSFQFKGRNEDIRGIAEKLNVDCVLEGSVRKAGNKLRITAQLIKASNGYHLWSDRFDRDMEDIFAVQDEIASTIVETLRTKLGVRAPAAALPKLVKRYTDNPDAYNLYLQGRHFWNSRREPTVRKGIECFKRAVEIDASYALAYTGLVEAYWFLAIYGFMRPGDAYSQVKAYADKALELDKDLSETHYAQGMMKHFFEWDWAGARAAYTRSIELNPKSASAHSWFSYLAALFDEDETIALSSRAMELEPYSPYVAATAGWAAHMVCRFELARERTDRALELDPAYVLANWMRAVPGLFLSEGAQSVARLERVVDTAGRQPLYLGFLGVAYGITGRTSEARQIAAGLEAQRSVRYVQPMTLAWVYAGLRDRDATLSSLEQAYAERDPLLLTVDAQLYFVRDEPRFQKILSQMKLPPFPAVRGK